MRKFCSYRRVKYLGDGVNQYQCLDCKNTIDVYSSDLSGWNFCPKCGTSWFTMMVTRPRDVPRWAWDKWKDEIPLGVRLRPEKPKMKRAWIIETRDLGSTGGWWGKNHVPVELGSWRRALMLLAITRADMQRVFEEEDHFRGSEVRVRILDTIQG